MKSKILVLSIATVLLVIYISTFSWLVVAWMFDEYYSHGFLVPLISGFIIWRKKDKLRGIASKPASIGIAVLIIGLLLHAFGIFWAVDFVSALSIIVVLSGLILYIGGVELFKALAFPVCFLIFMIPLPVYFLENQMQTTTADFVVVLLNAIGITASNNGAEVYLEKSAFFIGAPCSGLRSLISLITLAALYAYILEGTNRMKVVLLLASIPIALISNMFRITAILLIANSYGTEAAMNFFHNFSGITFFAIAIILLLLVGRCFGQLRFRKIF